MVVREDERETRALILPEGHVPFQSSDAGVCGFGGGCKGESLYGTRK